MSKNRNYRHRNFRPKDIPAEILEDLERLPGIPQLSDNYQIEIKNNDSLYSSGVVVRNLPLWKASGIATSAIESDPNVSVSIRQMDKEEKKDE